MRLVTCAFNGCEKPIRTRGWCNGHYEQARKGKVLAPLRQRRSDRTCSFQGCARNAHARDLCSIHYAQWWKGEELRTPEPLSYTGVHLRLRRELGPAGTRPCVDCGGSASEWSYDHEDPSELRGASVPGGRDLPYSTKHEHYQARCRPCHRRFDNRTARVSDAHEREEDDCG